SAAAGARAAGLGTAGRAERRSAARADGEGGEQLLQIGPVTSRTGRLLAAEQELLEALRAIPARVFVERHGGLRERPTLPDARLDPKRVAARGTARVDGGPGCEAIITAVPASAPDRPAE